MAADNFGFIYLEEFWEMTKTLTIGDHTVFRYMVRNLKYGNLVYATTVQIAEACDMARPSVSKSLHTLRDADIAVKLKRGEYMVNPILIRRGENKHGEMTAKYYAARKKAIAS